ncbi:MAG: hypothetical protein M3275_00130 [Thermoproteota archaeon]|nr:hypothetical protein [Thermoproteota archaeon]
MKKRIAAIATASLVVVAVVGIFSSTSIAITIQSAEAVIDPTSDLREPKAPMAVSEDGNKVYIV